MKITCPRCQQDWVKRVHLGAAQRGAFICPDCEALWFCEAAIHASTFVDLSEFLKREGLDYAQATFDTFVYSDREPGT